MLREVFIAWMDFAVADREKKRYRCGDAIMLYARDHQAIDIRGGVSGDTAWELCGRLMSAQPCRPSMSSRDLAQLIVFWLDARGDAPAQLPTSMRATLYSGMLEDMHKRRKTIETEQDEHVLQCRWIRQKIHLELDFVREDWAQAHGDLPVELDVEAAIEEGEAPSIGADAEAAATALLEDLREQTQQEVKARTEKSVLRNDDECCARIIHARRTLWWRAARQCRSDREELSVFRRALRRADIVSLVVIM